MRMNIKNYRRAEMFIIIAFIIGLVTGGIGGGFAFIAWLADAMDGHREPD